MSNDMQSLVNGNVPGVREIADHKPIRGIYFLVHGETVVYVGSSGDILRRIYSHGRRRMTYGRVFVLESAEPSLLGLEAYWIRTLRPFYNKSHNTPPIGPETLCELARRREECGISPGAMARKILLEPIAYAAMESGKQKMTPDVHGSIEAVLRRYEKRARQHAELGKSK